MVGENFEIYTSEMAKNALNILHQGLHTMLLVTGPDETYMKGP